MGKPQIIELADEMIRRHLDPDGVYTSADISERDQIIATLMLSGVSEREIAAALFRRLRTMTAKERR